MSGTAFGGSVTRVTTTQELPLGFQVTVPNGDAGDQVWIYVSASESLVVGSVCSLAAAATTYNVRKIPVDTHACTVVGVAQHVIAGSSYGFILRRGKGVVLADSGGVTVNLGMIAGDAVGTADAAAAVTDASFGVAQATAASATAACWLNCPG